jgi:hypothetical protein
MGIVGCLMMTAFVVYGLYRFVASRSARARFFHETWATLQSPRTLLFVLWASLGPLCLLIFFWGVLIPPLGRIKLGELELWQAAGLCALAWCIAWWATLLVTDHVRNQRLRRDRQLRSQKSASSRERNFA